MDVNAKESTGVTKLPSQRPHRSFWHCSHHLINAVGPVQLVISGILLSLRNLTIVDDAQESHVINDTIKRIPHSRFGKPEAHVRSFESEQFTMYWQ